MNLTGLIKNTLPLCVIALTLTSCLSISIKPTSNLEEGRIKTVNAEVTSSCGFTSVHAKYKRRADANWSNSGAARQSGNLFSSDIPGSDTFTAGDVYDFRWAVDYDSDVDSIFNQRCKTIPPATATADSSFAVVGCIPGATTVLPVRMRPQQTTQWCWAASGQMVMEYLGTNVAQCTQANDRLTRTDCCNDGGGMCGFSLITYPILHSACIQPNWPDLGHYGFTSNETANGTALSWNELRRQISDAPYCGSTPVVFSWNWTGGGGHAMVARGYHTLYLPVTDAPDVRINYVHVNNPWLPCFGDDQIITYDEYVARPGNHTHGSDIFDIRH